MLFFDVDGFVYYIFFVYCVKKSAKTGFNYERTIDELTQ